MPKWWDKATETEVENYILYNDIIPSLKAEYVNYTWTPQPFVEAVMDMDKASAEEANLRMIERQLWAKWDTASFNKFFEVDDKWNVSIWYKYEEYIKEQARMSAHLNDWDVDSFLAEAASITNLFTSSDPTWAITLSQIASNINRINMSDSLTAEQKAAASEVLLRDNYEFVQDHIVDLENKLWNTLGKEVTDALIRDILHIYIF